MHLWRIVEERHRWVGGRGVDEGGIGRTDGDGRTAERLELASSRLAALEYLDAALVGRDNEHRGATPGDLQLLEESTLMTDMFKFYEAAGEDEPNAYNVTIEDGESPEDVLQNEHELDRERHERVWRHIKLNLICLLEKLLANKKN